jgi:hypothetical protein
MDVYLEVGRKRVFAGAVEWPGWCRGDRDEASALQTLVAYGERYRRVAPDIGLPSSADDLTVVERLDGDATTDFGAPGAIPTVDVLAFDEAGLRRWLDLLAGCWSAFDSAVERARGRELATGPRGGGRDIDGIVEHVAGAHASYARKVGGLSDFDQSVVARWRGEVPETGPRGGPRWPPRYAIRRAAWHILDHAWEIEDRAGLGG